MTEPTKEQIDKWRSEFDEINKPHDYFEVESGKYGPTIVQRMWRNYFAAKKSDFEEIKTLKEQLAYEIKQREKAESVVKIYSEPESEEWINYTKELHGAKVSVYKDVYHLSSYAKNYFSEKTKTKQRKQG